MSVVVCPLCSTDFEPESCHSGCPMSRGCSMTRCPRCGHEFVDGESLSTFIKRLVSWRTDDSPAHR